MATLARRMRWSRPKQGAETRGRIVRFEYDRERTIAALKKTSLPKGPEEGFRGGEQNEVSAMNDETKPVEIELKLVLPGQEAESAVVACLRETGYTVEELDPVRNVDTYLDTFDWSLMKNKLALRYRVSNGSAMYTLKSIGPIEDGIAKRMETEIPLDGPVDVPASIPVKRDPQACGRDDLPPKAPRTDSDPHRPQAVSGHSHRRGQKSSSPSTPRASPCGGFTNRGAPKS